MKLYTTLFFLLLGSSTLFAQKSVTQAGIKITSAPLHCNVPSEGYEADLIALTITNTTNEVKTVSYSFELYYDNNCASKKKKLFLILLFHRHRGSKARRLSFRRGIQQLSTSMSRWNICWDQIWKL